MAILTPSAAPTLPSERHSINRDSTLRGWQLMGWMGAAFVAMGGMDIALAWYPPAFGKPEWEFGAISASLNGLALPLLGLYMMLGSAVAQGHRMMARGVGTLMALVAVGLIGLAVMYVTVVPLALQFVAQNAQLTTGVKKAVLKASVLFLVYIIVLAAGGFQSWRSTRTPKNVA